LIKKVCKETHEFLSCFHFQKGKRAIDSFSSLVSFSIDFLLSQKSNKRETHPEIIYIIKQLKELTQAIPCSRELIADFQPGRELMH
jgi:hypothetical protein